MIRIQYDDILNRFKLHENKLKFHLFFAARLYLSSFIIGTDSTKKY